MPRIIPLQLVASLIFPAAIALQGADVTAKVTARYTMEEAVVYDELCVSAVQKAPAGMHFEMLEITATATWGKDEWNSSKLPIKVTADGKPTQVFGCCNEFGYYYHYKQMRAGLEPLEIHPPRGPAAGPRMSEARTNGLFLVADNKAISVAAGGKALDLPAAMPRQFTDRKMVADFEVRESVSVSNISWTDRVAYTPDIDAVVSLGCSGQKFRKVTVACHVSAETPKDITIIGFIPRDFAFVQADGSFARAIVGRAAKAEPGRPEPDRLISVGRKSNDGTWYELVVELLFDESKSLDKARLTYLPMLVAKPAQKKP